MAKMGRWALLSRSLSRIAAVASNVGTWMQRVAQDWLVLELTHGSGTALGITTGLQFLPQLLFSLWGGVIADRYPKRRILFATDFSATSEAALPYATAICRRFRSTLHMVHVVSEASLLMMTGGVDYVSMGTIYEDAHNEAKDKLDQIAAHFETIPHRNYVRHGMVWKNLAEIIEESEIDLIVVGTHGRTGLGKLLLGLYLGHSGVTSAYGAAGSLVLVLLWVYYSSLIVFFGAEFTQVYANTYGSGVVPTQNAESISTASDRKTQARPPEKRRA